MSELSLLVHLAGEAALLLWGLHMVQSGVERAFGGRLQAMLGRAMAGPGRALLAGLGVTAALQSSTATALMIAGFASAGAVALVPALAAMLGANVGTALIVQLLSFDASWLSPLLILLGVVAFRKSSRTQIRDIGRAGIGLGLMLLALHLMVGTLAPVESSPAFARVLAELADHPVIVLLLAALIAWAAHSSIAGVLFVASLAGSGVLGTEAALAMVAGANLGSAINPLLQSGRPGDRARLRLPVGNLLNRVLGCVLVIAFLPTVAAWMTALDAAPVRLVANAHLAFNLATSLLFLPLLRPLAWALQRLLPDRPELDEAAPRYLDARATEVPSVAMANAQREVLRIADVLERMLDASARAFDAEDRDAAKALADMDDVVDRLHRAVLAYLAAIPAEGLGEVDTRRLSEIQSFAIALEHAADVLTRDVARHATKRVRRGVVLASEDRKDLTELHEALREQLRLAVAVFMVEDAEAARRLVRAKEELRGTEREAARRAALAAPLPLGEPGATPGFVLDAIRDLRRVGGHLAAVAHPLLERRGELLSSRLAPTAEG
ncbi:Na/Pi cotransporter family protein [Falsiroseomonas oryziterrae]|uniref:Na/Pi cotransporter family protein n=1 Tax=Falsiroseomonas oryziterrae TaxID=2911368 RepID=UPI001F17A2A8|nr:Na/Pi cotransporter family protein [Roseomonas sp. NPKOSM-4]